MGEGRIILEVGNNTTSKVGITACKLVCKGGEDIFELLPVEVIPGAEEASTKNSFLGGCFRERLSYCRFSGAR